MIDLCKKLLVHIFNSLFVSNRIIGSLFLSVHGYNFEKVH